MTRRIFVLGATGTIGRATVRALVRRGHEVVCFVRPRAGVGAALGPQEMARLLPGAQLRFGDVTARDDGFLDPPRNERCDRVADEEKQQRAKQHAECHRNAAFDRLSVDLDFFLETHHFERPNA